MWSGPGVVRGHFTWPSSARPRNRRRLCEGGDWRQAGASTGLQGCAHATIPGLGALCVLEPEGHRIELWQHLEANSSDL
jgi:hypothetical protein